MDAVNPISNGMTGLSGTGKGRSAEGQDFLDTLRSLTAQVEKRLGESDHKAEAFSVGNPEDLHEIMIAGEKADLSLRLLLQIRNKLLSAYQEIMRMQF